MANGVGYYERNKERIKETSRRNYYKNHEENKEYRRKYYAENSDVLKEQQAIRRAECTEQDRKVQREWHLKTKYGITTDEYNEQVEKQNNKCFICDSPPPDNKRLYVDHCHTTGKVGKLLCHNCNAGLGHFKDNEGLLLKAISYIRENR